MPSLANHNYMIHFKGCQELTLKIWRLTLRVTLHRPGLITHTILKEKEGGVGRNRMLDDWQMKGMERMEMSQGSLKV